MTEWRFDPGIELARGGIAHDEARRQERTARVVVQRLGHQPGLVLADEVGMGKTFVALATAASISATSDQPAVVMCPPRLVDKWERDAQRFDQLCFAGRSRGTAPFSKTAHTGADFLRCFDDPPNRRAILVILANTALHRTERDPWVKLAIIKRSLAYSQADAARFRVVARYARDILRHPQVAGLGEQHFASLLDTRVDGWRTYLDREAGLRLDDDPVPMPFYNALKGHHLRSVGEALEGVPLRSSSGLDERLLVARRAIDDALREVWPEALHAADISSPLLIFDEAHHLKNPSTRLASLFESSEAASILAGTFERMLFLTATPFQLGHGELLEVLRRFRAVRWETISDEHARSAFETSLVELESVLDDAQLQSLTLERLWGAVAIGDVVLGEDGELPPGAWRAMVSKPPAVGPLAAVVTQYERARGALKRAEALLGPWIIRHTRARVLQTPNGQLARRLTLAGKSILDGVQQTAGIDVTGDARFPFLLCARAQGLLARSSGRRAYFAEGLASSYGAFLDTSKPTDDADIALQGEDEAGYVNWYVEQVRDLLGGQRAAVDHPKVGPTVERAVHHWLAGDKVLVFGHYKKTIRDLTDALSARIEVETVRLGARALGVDRTKTSEVRQSLDRISDRLADRDSPMHREVRGVLARWVGENLVASLRDRVVDLLLHVLRTPSFLVRHLPIDRVELRESLAADRPTAAQSRAAADAVAESLARRSTGRGASYRQRVDAFVSHLTGDLISDQEREALLTDLEAAQMEPVLHADGDVSEETRRRRLRGFNSPLMPEIFVVSEVMAEGLDLHLDCRHVIHHDLSWNPSTLEQRTGRVDRLRCRAEIDGESILVYVPYLAGTADEKMYRVVSDRARWFQIVMGEKYAVDEASTDKLARRIPFPEEASRELMFSLGVADDDR